MNVSNARLVINLALVYISLMLLFNACTAKDKGKIKMFELLSSKETGITFRNDVAESLTNNIYLFTNFYRNKKDNI